MQLLIGQVLVGLDGGRVGQEGPPPWSREEALQEAASVIGSTATATLRYGYEEKGAPAIDDLRTQSQLILESLK